MAAELPSSTSEVGADNLRVISEYKRKNGIVALEQHEQASYTVVFLEKGARARLEQQDSLWGLRSGFESHRRPKIRVEP